MGKIIDYAIISICSIAMVINLLRLLRLLADPGFLRRPLFDFPTDKLRRSLMILCTIAVLLGAILIKLKR